MGADSFVAFYGIKITLDPDDEDLVDAYGADTHPHCHAALAAGLETHTGRLTDGADYFVYLGRRLGRLGLEHDPHVDVPQTALAEAVATVGPLLVMLDHHTRPALHLQFEGQY